MKRISGYESAFGSSDFYDEKETSYCDAHLALIHGDSRCLDFQIDQILVVIRYWLTPALYPQKPIIEGIRLERFQI